MQTTTNKQLLLIDHRGKRLWHWGAQDAGGVNLLIKRYNYLGINVVKVDFDDREEAGAFVMLPAFDEYLLNWNMHAMPDWPK